MATIDFKDLAKDYVNWTCCKSDSKNLISTFKYHSYGLSNWFDPFSSINSSTFSISSPSVDHIHPLSHSSHRATTPQHVKHNTPSTTSQVKSISDCSLSFKDYCNSIQGKGTKFKTAMYYIKQQIIIGKRIKTWLCHARFWGFPRRVCSLWERQEARWRWCICCHQSLIKDWHQHLGKYKWTGMGTSCLEGGQGLVCGKFL